MVEAGQLADPVAGLGDAHDVLGSAVEHVALARHALVEGQDAAPGDVLGEDPADRERQVALDAPRGARTAAPG